MKKRSTYVEPTMTEQDFLLIVAQDLLDMAINKEANFDYVPSVREFIVKYSTPKGK